MGQLVPILKGEAHLDYSAWFSDPAVASMYTQAQHNGSLATAKALFKRVNLKGLGIQQMLDVGGGSGAFSLQAVRMGAENMKSVVLELPKVCAEGRNLLSSEASSQEIWEITVPLEPRRVIGSERTWQLTLFNPPISSLLQF